MRRSRMRCLRFEHRSNTRRTGYRSKAGSETRTMAVSLGRSDVPGAQYGVLTESPGSRDVSGSFFAPKPTKNRIRSYPMGRAVITRSYGDIFVFYFRLIRKRNLWPAKKGRKYAFSVRSRLSFRVFTSRGVITRVITRDFFWRIYMTKKSLP